MHSGLRKLGYLANYVASATFPLPSAASTRQSLMASVYYTPSKLLSPLYPVNMFFLHPLFITDDIL